MQIIKKYLRLIFFKIGGWEYIEKNLVSDELVICMGAGSISNWIREISNKLK